MLRTLRSESSSISAAPPASNTTLAIPAPCPKAKLPINHLCSPAPRSALQLQPPWLFQIQFGESAVLAGDLFWCAEPLHFGSFVQVGLAFAFYHSWNDMTSDIVIGFELEHFDDMRRSFWSFHEGFDAVSQTFDNAFTFID